MRRLAGSELGSLDNFRFEDVAVPSPGPGQVRIRTSAVALGFVDGLIAAGLYQIKPALPFVPGGEIGGVVDMVGSGVAGIQPGARVVTWQLGGGLAEYVIVSASDVDAIPDMLDIATATAMLVDYQTARYALLERGKLSAGETVLVAGAAGGVGSAAIQIARSYGAHVIALASNSAKQERALEMGAHSALSPSKPSLREDLRRLAPDGLNIVFDPIGGVTSELMFRSLAKDGRHLVVGFASGTIPSIRANLALVKSASLVGVDIRHYLAAYPDEAKQARFSLFEQVELRRLSGPLVTPFRFEQAKDALEETGKRHRLGKLVVLM